MEKWNNYERNGSEWKYGIIINEGIMVRNLEKLNNNEENGSECRNGRIMKEMVRNGEIEE